MAITVRQGDWKLSQKQEFGQILLEEDNSLCWAELPSLAGLHLLVWIYTNFNFPQLD
jgi:hypothetical protein